MDSVHYHLSYFIPDDIKFGIRYVLACVKNMMEFRANPERFSSSRMVIHTDGRTAGLIDRICKQEDFKIPPQIDFIIHQDSGDMTGMFWRQEAVFDNLCEVAAIGEGDDSILSPSIHVPIFLKTGASIQAFVNRKFNDRIFCLAGCFAFRPNFLSPEFIIDVKTVLEEVYKMGKISYGLDEIFMTQMMLKYADTKMYIKMNPSRSVDNRIEPEDVDEQKPIYQSHFPAAFIADVDKYHQLVSENPLPKAKTPPRLKHLSKDGQFYSLGGEQYNICLLNRTKIDRNRNEFIRTIRKIINFKPRKG